MICVDTDVMIDILRRYTPAVAWLRSRSAEDLAWPDGDGTLAGMP
jgi:hypothetical protein